MILRPSFPDHLKLAIFKRTLQHAHAAEFILRLWLHCEEDQRTGDWGKVDAVYVESVCCWDGPPGVLWDTLLMPYYDKPGFIQVDPDGNLTVTGWNEHNASLIASWANGRKSKERKQRDNPAVVLPPPPMELQQPAPNAAPTGNAADTPCSVVQGSSVQWSYVESKNKSNPSHAVMWAAFERRNRQGEKPAFTFEEVRMAYLAFEASAFDDGSWRWGKGLCHNPTAAFETRILQQREIKNVPAATSGAVVIALGKEKDELNTKLEGEELTPEQRLKIRLRITEIETKLREVTQ